MISVGITGGIGSGKTTVCHFFELLGIPVYYADLRAKSLMVEDQDLIAAIKKTFGEASYSEKGQLNREYLAKVVFNNDVELQKLNALVHPAVFKDTANWMQKNADQSYVLYEAAIMFESGSYKMLNKVITVYSPESMRLERVMGRDNVTEQEVRSRMAKQMSEEEKIKLADFVIYNDLKQPLISQILKIHKELISLSHS
ncbi:MAG: dephospho-CoA kinase [Chitinophagales bacterium]